MNSEGLTRASNVNVEKVHNNKGAGNVTDRWSSTTSRMIGKVTENFWQVWVCAGHILYNFIWDEFAGLVCWSWPRKSFIAITKKRKSSHVLFSYTFGQDFVSFTQSCHSWQRKSLTNLRRIYRYAWNISTSTQPLKIFKLLTLVWKVLKTWSKVGSEGKVQK